MNFYVQDIFVKNEKGKNIMEVKQIYEFVNTAVKQSIGDSVVVAEDLKNIVDVGTAVFNANAYDNYVNKLVDAIGKVIFVSRKYEGFAPKILMDSVEYGSVVEKIRCEIPEAEENKSWSLVDGQEYPQDTFHAPKISVKFFNSKTTFQVPVSITRIQVKESFTNVDKLNGFIEMIYNAMDNGMTEKFDAIIQRTITNMVAETIISDYTDLSKLSDSSGIKAVNLLKLYNSTMGTTLTASKALYDKAFLQFASMTISKYTKRLKAMSKLFNVTGAKKFTSSNMLHVVLLSDFVKATEVYLESDTFHNELVKLPLYEEVPYWQGTGTDYTENGKIDVKPSSNNTKEVKITGALLGVMFDKYAIGCTNYDKRVPTHANEGAEFWNLWYKQDCAYFNDLDENFVCFFIQ